MSKSLLIKLLSLLGAAAIGTGSVIWFTQSNDSNKNKTKKTEKSAKSESKQTSSKEEKEQEVSIVEKMVGFWSKEGSDQSDIEILNDVNTEIADGYYSLTIATLFDGQRGPGGSNILIQNDQKITTKNRNFQAVSGQDLGTALQTPKGTISFSEDFNTMTFTDLVKPGTGSTVYHRK